MRIAGFAVAGMLLGAGGMLVWVTITDQWALLGPGIVLLVLGTLVLGVSTALAGAVIVRKRALEDGRGGVARLDHQAINGRTDSDGDPYWDIYKTVVLDNGRAYLWKYEVVGQVGIVGEVTAVWQPDPSKPRVRQDWGSQHPVPSHEQTSRLPAPGQAPLWGSASMMSPAWADLGPQPWPGPASTALEIRPVEGFRPLSRSIREPIGRFAALVTVGVALVVGVVGTQAVLDSEMLARIPGIAQEYEDPETGVAPGGSRLPDDEAQAPASAAQSLNPYDADDLQTILTELVAMAGTEETVEVVVHTHMVQATMPKEPGSDKWDEYRWHEIGGFQHTGAAIIQPDPERDKTFHIGDIDPHVVADVLARTPVDGGFPEEEPSHAIIEHFVVVQDPGAPTITTYVGDDYGNAMLTYALDGTLLKVM